MPNKWWMCRKRSEKKKSTTKLNVFCVICVCHFGCSNRNDNSAKYSIVFSIAFAHHSTNKLSHKFTESRFDLATTICLVYRLTLTFNFRCSKSKCILIIYITMHWAPAHIPCSLFLFCRARCFYFEYFYLNTNVYIMSFHWAIIMLCGRCAFASFCQHMRIDRDRKQHLWLWCCCFCQFTSMPSHNFDFTVVVVAFNLRSGCFARAGARSLFLFLRAILFRQTLHVRSRRLFHK